MATYAPDKIFAPAKTIKELARKVPTPFYIYDRQGIEDALAQISQWFIWADAHQNYFPLRENTNREILCLLGQTGSGVGVCNVMELKLAQECGFSGQQLLYIPTGKDTEAEALARELCATWLVNCPALLPEELPENLILRYLPSDLRMTPMQTRNVGRSKNGFTRQQLLETLTALSVSDGIHIGLALEVNAYNVSVGAWRRKAEILDELSREIEEKTSVRIKSWYLGEGPGLPYRPQAVVPDPAEEARAVEALYAQLPADRRPTIFTGISKRLLEPHGLFITKVLHLHSAYRTFLVVDGSMCQYVRPVLKQAYRHISILGRDQIEGRKLYTVVGELPDEMDRFDQKGRMLPVAKPGDYCVIHDVGCGGRSMPLLYGFHSIPAEYLYQPDGSFTQIAPHRTAEQVREFLTAW